LNGNRKPSQRFISSFRQFHLLESQKPKNLWSCSTMCSKTSHRFGLVFCIIAVQIYLYFLDTFLSLVHFYLLFPQFAPHLDTLRAYSSQSRVPSSSRLRSYSAHDDTLGPLLATLGSFANSSEFHWPAYASNVVIELWRNNGTQNDAMDEQLPSFSVRVLLDGSPLPLLAWNGEVCCVYLVFRCSQSNVSSSFCFIYFSF